MYLTVVCAYLVFRTRNRRKYATVRAGWNKGMGTNMNDEPAYGRRIARLREEAGWTQEELAEKSGISLRALQAIESGETTKPQRATREHLEAALGAGNPEQAESGFPIDVRVFLNTLGAWLSTFPDERTRERVIYAETRRIFDDYRDSM